MTFAYFASRETRYTDLCCALTRHFAAQRCNVLSSSVRACIDAVDLVSLHVHAVVRGEYLLAHPAASLAVVVTFQ